MRLETSQHTTEVVKRVGLNPYPTCFLNFTILGNKGFPEIYFGITSPEKFGQKKSVIIDLGRLHTLFY